MTLGTGTNITQFSSVFGPEHGYSWEPRQIKPKRKPLRVFEMKRFFRALMGKCEGIMVSTGRVNAVLVHFDTAEDAHRFYSALDKLDPLEGDRG